MEGSSNDPGGVKRHSKSPSVVRSRSEDDYDEPTENSENFVDVSRSIGQDPEITPPQTRQKYVEKPMTEEEYNELEEVLTNPTRQEGKELNLNRYDRNRVPVPTIPKESIAVADMKEIIHQLSCDICQDVVSSSVMTKKCGHRFCDQCIMLSIMRSSNTCPACRQPLASKRELQQDPRFDGIIDQLIDNRQEIPKFLKVKRKPPPDCCAEDSDSDVQFEGCRKRRRDEEDNDETQYDETKKKRDDDDNHEDDEMMDNEDESDENGDSDSDSSESATDESEDYVSDENEEDEEEAEDEEYSGDEDEEEEEDEEDEEEVEEIENEIDEDEEESVEQESENFNYEKSEASDSQSSGIVFLGEKKIIDTHDEQNNEKAGNEDCPIVLSSGDEEVPTQYFFRDGQEVSDIRKYAPLLQNVDQMSQEELLNLEAYIRQSEANIRQSEANIRQSEANIRWCDKNKARVTRRYDLFQNLVKFLQDQSDIRIDKYFKYLEDGTPDYLNRTFMKAFKEKVGDTDAYIKYMRNMLDDLTPNSEFLRQFNINVPIDLADLDKCKAFIDNMKKRKVSDKSLFSDEKDDTEALSDYDADISGEWDDDEIIILSDSESIDEVVRMPITHEAKQEHQTSTSDNRKKRRRSKDDIDDGYKNPGLFDTSESSDSSEIVSDDDAVADSEKNYDKKDDDDNNGGTANGKNRNPSENHHDDNNSEHKKTYRDSTHEDPGCNNNKNDNTSTNFSLEFKDATPPKGLHDQDDWELRREAENMTRDRIEKLLEQECAYEEGQLYRMYKCVKSRNYHLNDSESDMTKTEDQSESSETKFQPENQQDVHPSYENDIPKTDEFTKIEQQTFETSPNVVDTTESSNCEQPDHTITTKTITEIFTELDIQKGDDISELNQKDIKPIDQIESGVDHVVKDDTVIPLSPSNETVVKCDPEEKITPEICQIEKMECEEPIDDLGKVCAVMSDSISEENDDFDEVSSELSGDEEYKMRTSLVNHKHSDEILYHDTVRLLKDIRGSTPLAGTVLDLLSRDFLAEYELKSSEKFEEYNMKAILGITDVQLVKSSGNDKPVTDIEQIILNISNMAKLETLTKSALVEQLEYWNLIDDEGKPIGSSELDIQPDRLTYLSKSPTPSERVTNNDDQTPILSENRSLNQNDSREFEEMPSLEAVNPTLTKEPSCSMEVEGESSEKNCQEQTKMSTNNDEEEFEQDDDDLEEDDDYEDEEEEEEESEEDDVDGASEDDYGSVYSDSDESEVSFSDPTDEKSLFIPTIPKEILEKYRLQKLESEKKKYREKTKVTKMANIRITVPQYRPNFAYQNQSSTYSSSIVQKPKKQKNPNVHISIVQPPLPLHQLQYSMNPPAKITAVPNMGGQHMSHMNNQKIHNPSSSMQQQFGLRTPKPDMKEDIRKFENECRQRLKLEEQNRQYLAMYQAAQMKCAPPPNTTPHMKNQMSSSNFGAPTGQQPSHPQDSLALLHQLQAQQHQLMIAQMQRMQALQFAQIPGMSHMGIPANMGIQHAAPNMQIPGMAVPRFGVPQPVGMQAPYATHSNYMMHQQQPHQQHQQPQYHNQIYQNYAGHGTQPSQLKQTPQNITNASGFGQTNYMNSIYQTTSSSQQPSNLPSQNVVEKEIKPSLTKDINQTSADVVVENEVEIELWPTNGYRLKKRSLGGHADTVFCGSSGSSTFNHVARMLISRIPGHHSTDLGSFWAFRRDNCQLKKFALRETLADAQKFVGCQHLVIFYDDIAKGDETSNEYIVNSEYKN